MNTSVLYAVSQLAQSYLRTDSATHACVRSQNTAVYRGRRDPAPPGAGTHTHSMHITQSHD
eukprot:1569762-Pleurochrysis_carterae.AAC.3